MRIQFNYDFRRESPILPEAIPVSDGLLYKQNTMDDQRVAGQSHEAAVTEIWTRKELKTRQTELHKISEKAWSRKNCANLLRLKLTW